MNRYTTNQTKFLWLTFCADYIYLSCLWETQPPIWGKSYFIFDLFSFGQQNSAPSSSLSIFLIITINWMSTIYHNTIFSDYEHSRWFWWWTIPLSEHWETSVLPSEKPKARKLSTFQPLSHRHWVAVPYFIIGLHFPKISGRFYT